MELYLRNGKNWKIKQDKPRDQALAKKDIEILYFLWKWKAAGTATIFHALKLGASAPMLIRRLKKLAEREEIQYFTNNSAHPSMWRLTDRGYDTIFSRLGKLTNDYFGSGDGLRDRSALAIQLGEWHLHSIKMEHISAQELSSRPMDYFPDWVPNHAGHSPMGFSKFPDGSVIAYEVEIKEREYFYYKQILDWYAAAKKFERVFWLIGDKNIPRQILDIANSNDVSAFDNHVFISLEDYACHGWDAKIINGDFSIRDDWERRIGIILRAQDGIHEYPLGAQVHFDPRKMIGV